MANRFREATTTIVATATQNLSELSFDFQSELDVRRVNVNGRYVRFHFDAATPPLAGDGTQLTKFVVEPTRSARPRAGEEFTVVVTYRGTPQEIIDPDGASEGWIPACYPLNPPRTCDGAFVVNEPMGAQGWFPNNNHPIDKATFDTIITVPATKTALGIGELVSRTVNRNRTVTWHWTEDDPSATYLTTATVGDFTYTQGSMLETSTGVTLPVYNAVDTRRRRPSWGPSTPRSPKRRDSSTFLSDLYGPYPFDSTGAVADKASGVGYALEVQTKPHYPGGFTSGNPSINISTQLHEISHQWWGNSVTRERGPTSGSTRGGPTGPSGTGRSSRTVVDDPALIFDDLYASTPSEDWTLAPAVLDGDPVNLFAIFPTRRPAGCGQPGVREIVGDDRVLRGPTQQCRQAATRSAALALHREAARRALGGAARRGSVCSTTTSRSGSTSRRGRPCSQTTSTDFTHLCAIAVFCAAIALWLSLPGGTGFAAEPRARSCWCARVPCCRTSRARRWPRSPRSSARIRTASSARLESPPPTTSSGTTSKRKSRHAACSRPTSTRRFSSPPGR